MKGEIILFDKTTNIGKISGHDGNRYAFTRQDWSDNQIPRVGMSVDFEVVENNAKEIILLSKKHGRSSGDKDKTTAALLALFLGGIGVHKFYLGQSGTGIVYLLVFWTFIPAIIAFVEAIILFTQSEEKFDAQYN